MIEAPTKAEVLELYSQRVLRTPEAVYLEAFDDSNSQRSPPMFSFLPKDIRVAYEGVAAFEVLAYRNFRANNDHAFFVDLDLDERRACVPAECDTPVSALAELLSLEPQWLLWRRIAKVEPKHEPTQETFSIIQLHLSYPFITQY
jgi:hypothetical protein